MAAAQDSLGDLRTSLISKDDTDLSVEERMNPYDWKNTEIALKMSKRIHKTLDVDRFQRSLFEREWFRNVLFYAGQHWIIYEKGRWRPRALPAWFPRAQTNKFAEKANDVISALMQSGRVPIFAEPSNDDPKSQATAEIYMDAREVMYQEAGIDNLTAELATWVVLTGNGFLLPWYDDDPSTTGHTFIQSMRCTKCGVVSKPVDIDGNDGNCPACGSEDIPDGDLDSAIDGVSPIGEMPQPDMTGELADPTLMPQPQGELDAAGLVPPTDAAVPEPVSKFEPAQDPEGEDLGETYPFGCLRTDVCSPFEIRLDHRIRRFEDQKRFIRMRRYDVDEAKQLFDLDEVLPDNGQDLSQYYLDVLAQVTGSFSASSGGFIGGGPSSPKNPKVTAYEFFELPSDDFPEGLHAIQLGASKIVFAEELKTEVQEGPLQGQKQLGLLYFGFDTIPGRLWRKTRMDDMIPLQIFRNTIEANLRLTIQRMGNPIWLDPKGSGVSNLTGEPGQVVPYNPVSLGGTNIVKPERVPAELSNLAPLIQMMNKCDDSMERVSGTFFLQGGDTPPGVTAASALAYLGERASKSMSPLMHEWAKGWKRWEEFCIEVVRAKWDDNRLRMVAGRNKKWEVKQFKGSDLQGAINIKINYEGLQPKSLATERATIGQLVQLQVLNPQDPEVNYQILQKFGEANLKGSADLDVKYAQREADKFLSEQIPPVLRPMVDNSVVHLSYHTDFAKTDEFLELPQEAQDLWIAHIRAHVVDMMQRQQALAMAGIDPSNPQMGGLMTSGDAQAAAMAAAQAQAATAAQNGGVPNGAEGPDARLNAQGAVPPGAAAPSGPPDLAVGPPDPGAVQMPPGISKIQTPRSLGA